MPITQTKSIKNLVWEHRFAAIFKCSSRTSNPDEIAVADDAAIASNERLQHVLQALQRDLIFKPIYQYAKNPTTRILPFRENSNGKSNKAQPLLNMLISAKKKDEVEAQAVQLAQQYMRTKNIQNGLLIFLVSEGKFDGQPEGTCAFVFKCDFEEISQLSGSDLFRKVEDAIVEKTKKGAVYPYYSESKFDDTKVRVFDEFGDTQYWRDFLELSEPPSRVPPLQAVTLEEWDQIKPDAPERYKEKIRDLAGGRSLVKKELFTEQGDRLTQTETETLITAVTAKTGKQNISLRLDQARATVPLDEYGKSWIIAEQGGMRFILLKGDELRMATDMLNPIDLAGRPTLTQALKRLGI
ncbi:MAG TPA: DUF3900 domain-containing protein [Pyrinomonadaceae bacterium]|nr:DUF3900 domain-containing protein [Pyrinomonadaceae bacterium]